MKQLQISEQTVKELYKTSTSDFKKVLEESFGKDFFIENITEKIKTLKDVYEHLGIVREAPYKNPKNKQEKVINAVYDIQNISRVLNEGWIPDWTTANEPKYYNYFEYLISGWRYAASYGFHFGAGWGFGFCFKTSKLARHAAETFLDIYIDYLPE